MQCTLSAELMRIFYLLACPFSLGLGSGRIRDEQLSASSELDDTHAAKQGRASIYPGSSRYLATDKKAQFSCI